MCGRGGAPFTWTPSPSSLLLLVLSPSPSSCLLQGQEAVRGASSPQEGVPSFLGGGYRERRVITVRLSSILLDVHTPQGGGTEGGQGPPDPASPVPVAAAPLHLGRDPFLKGDGNLTPTRGLREGARGGAAINHSGELSACARLQPVMPPCEIISDI